MNKQIVLFILLSLLVGTGCVSSKEYKARLSDISNLEQNVADLEEMVEKTEDEKAALEEELSALRKDYEEVVLIKDTLSEEKTGLESDLDVERAKHQEELRLKNMKIEQNITAIGRLSEEKSRAIEEKERAIAELKNTYDDLVSEMEMEIKEGEIEITQLKDKLSLRMVEEVLFDSGSSEIKKAGQKVLDRVAEILIKVEDKQIKIEGHTDNVPIGSRLAKKFPTNWELSTARAITVVRYLQEKGGIDPDLLGAAGYSEFRPVASNETEEGRSKNRRIEITLMPIDFDRVPMQRVTEESTD